MASSSPLFYKVLCKSFLKLNPEDICLLTHILNHFATLHHYWYMSHLSLTHGLLKSCVCKQVWCICLVTDDVGVLLCGRITRLTRFIVILAKAMMPLFCKTLSQII